MKQFMLHAASSSQMSPVLTAEPLLKHEPLILKLTIMTQKVKVKNGKSETSQVIVNQKTAK